MKNSIKDTYHIGGMSCGGCATIVEYKLSASTGVTSAQVDLANKQAEITSSEVINTNTLQDALKNTHYTISELRVV
jgi:copper chaperone CopZ